MPVQCNGLVLYPTASAVKFGADRAYGIIGTVMRGGIKLCDNMNFLEVICLCWY